MNKTDAAIDKLIHHAVYNPGSKGIFLVRNGRVESTLFEIKTRINMCWGLRTDEAFVPRENVFRITIPFNKSHLDVRSG